MTVNSKEENSKEFCFDFVQEFGLVPLRSWAVHCTGQLSMTVLIQQERMTATLTIRQTLPPTPTYPSQHDRYMKLTVLSQLAFSLILQNCRKLQLSFCLQIKVHLLSLHKNRPIKKIFMTLYVDTDREPLLLIYYGVTIARYFVR